MKYSTKIVLYNSYFDVNDRISIKSILNIFQDVASIHAEEIGVGYQEMLNKNLYWVLSRIKIDIIQMPEINQSVIVETWPHEKGRIDFDRDLRILSEDGKVLIIGTSKWCVIDTINRKLQRSDNINYNGEIYPKLNYEDKLNKISIPNNEIIEKSKYKVAYSDLDHNLHMNNTNYANLVMNTIKNKKISHFEINFLNECRLDDEITLYHTSDNSHEYVIGKIKETQTFTALVY